MLSLFFFFSWFDAKDFPSISMQQPKGGPNFSLAPQARCLRVNLGIRLRPHPAAELDPPPKSELLDTPWYILGEAQN